MGKDLRLPPGYRFHPTDDELVLLYLKKKIKGQRFYPKAVAEVDVYKFAPWELPAKSKSGSGDLQWYFLCPVEKKYSRGHRINRETKDGCWKKTGNDSPVHHDKELVGSKKTLVFHKNLDLAATGIQGRRAPQRKRTDWVMHEYSLEDQYMAREGIVKNTHVLCVIFEKDGLGPRIRAQYGAPFNEDEGNNNEEDDSAEAVTSAGSLPNNISGSAAIDTQLLGGTTSESCLSEAMQSQCERVSAVLNNDASNELSRVLGNGDILPEVLTSVKDNNPLNLSEDDRNKNFNHEEHAEAALYLSDIMGDGFEDLAMDDYLFDIVDLDLPPDSPPT